MTCAEQADDFTGKAYPFRDVALIDGDLSHDTPGRVIQVCFGRSAILETGFGPGARAGATMITLIDHSLLLSV